MTEKRVDVKVRAQAEGFEKLGRQAKEAMSATSPPRDSAKKFSDLEKTLARVAKAAHAATEAMSGKKALAGLQALVRETEKLGRVQEQNARNANKTPTKAAITGAVWGGGVGGAIGGNAAGLGAGAAIGGFLGKHTGAGHAGGIAGGVIGGIGARAWGIGRPLSSVPMTGMTGLQQGLGAIPVVGQFAAGQLGNGIAAAQAALGVQQARHAMNPFLSTGYMPADHRMANSARALAESRVRVPAFISYKATQPDVVKMALAQQRGAGAIAALWDSAVGRVPNDEGANLSARESAALLLTQQSRLANDRAKAARRRAGQAAHDDVMYNSDPFTFIKRTGVGYGQDERAAMQAAAGYFGARGGTMDRSLISEEGRGQYRAAMEAQGRYGVSMESSGGLARGALNGAGRVDLEKVIKAGVSQGLGGSDLEKYVQDMAARVQNFEQTGIPVAQDSLNALQQGFAASMGGIRGGNAAAALMAKTQATGMSGPSSSAEWAMMTTMGGYKGGGIGAWMEAKRNLEHGGVAGGFQKLIKKAANSGNADADTWAVQKLMASLNVSMGQDEARALATGDPTAVAKWQGVLSQGSMDAGNVNLAGGAGKAGGGSQAAAANANANADVGATLLKAAQNLEQLNISQLKNFSAFAGKLTAFTAWAEQKSKSLEKNFVDADRLLGLGIDWLEHHK